MQRSKLIIIPIVVLSMMLAIAAFMFHWTIDRIYVPEGQSLQLRYKGPLIFGQRIQAEPGMWAKEGQMGILEKMRGPGRHFYCPIWWERKLVDDVVIKPGEIGEVTCKL